MTIPTDWWFTRMSSDARAALTPDQIRGLNTQNIGIRRLNDQQVGWLAYWQIRTLSYGDFNRLTPAQVPMLLGRQLSQIPSDWWFGRMRPESRAALSARQVQSLNVESLGLRRLAASQVESLTPEQIQSVGFREFRYIGPAQIPLLTAAQVGTIESSWWFSRMSEEARAELTAEQVQALDVATTGIETAHSRPDRCTFRRPDPVAGLPRISLPESRADAATGDGSGRDDPQQLVVPPHVGRSPRDADRRAGSGT